MKICFIASLYEPYIIGGAEVYLKSIASVLAKKHQITVLTTRPYQSFASLKPKYATRDGIKIYDFYPLNIYHLFQAKQKPIFLKPFWHFWDIINPYAYAVIIKMLKREKPDVVHTHNLSGLSWSAIKAVKKMHLPLVHTVHDFSLLCPFAILTCSIKGSGQCKLPTVPCIIYRAMKKQMINNKPDIVIFPSQAVLDIYQAESLFLNTKKVVLNHGIPETFRFLPSKKDAYFDILFVGQLEKHKGVQVLIEAFKNLQEKNIRLHIVGSGDYEATLKKLAGNDKGIIFYGKVDHEKIFDFYKFANVVIVPSVWPEVLGIVILESFCAGVPVIGSNIGGINELVRPGYNGFLFESGNSEALKTVLKQLMNSPVLLRQLSVNAIQSSSRFGLQEHIKRLEQLYVLAIERNCRVQGMEKKCASH